jgi:hypothetical protein
MAIVLDGTTGITTPNVASDTSTLGPLTQALNLGSTGQIQFPATQNASANANTLDDYEEGTFTPVLADALTGGNTATGTFSASYTKIGNVVICNIAFPNIVTTGMSSGNVLYFRNLPFVSNGSELSTGSCLIDRLTFSGFVAPIIFASGVVGDFREYVSNASDASLTVSDIAVSGASDIFISITYLTS